MLPFKGIAPRKNENALIIYYLVSPENTFGVSGVNSVSAKYNTTETPEVFRGLKHFTRPSIGIVVR